MDWADIADLIAPAAPTLGKLIGSAIPLPFGGQIGQVVGQAVADAIGVAANPSTVATTVSSTHPEVLQAQLSELEQKWKAVAAAAQAEAGLGQTQVDAVGRTMQAELGQGVWYQRLWRPLAMYVWIASWPFQLGLILWQISSKDATVIANLGSVINSLAIWNAGPAALAGVYSWNRTQEKVAGK